MPDYFAVMRYWATTVLAAFWIGLSVASVAAAAPRPADFDPRRHMAVDEVRPGMVGYGRTVYHGTEVETFDVEVVSVEHGWQPGKSVVWIRCTDERMQQLGPVSGMSGSPIYLWPIGTEPGDRRAGDGGRMIGAFAYGFGMGKDCYAGVQPIEQMLAASERSRMPDADGAPGGGADQTGGGESRGDAVALAHAVAALKQSGLPEAQTWRTRALAELVDLEPASRPAAPRSPGRSQRMMLPLMVGSARQAELLRPLLEPRGVRPVAGGGPTGMPPRWIDARSIAIEPGGVAAVPLVTGDMVLPAVGTITEVLRDDAGNIRRILAFGHSFNGTGEVNLPFATGFVHYVQPSLISSFKLGGAGQVIGALINDEMTAVVGAPGIEHPFAPSIVRVDWPGESRDQTYRYQLAREPFFTPLLAGMTAANSVTSDTAIPPYHTLEAETTMRFTNGRSLDVRTLAPGGMAGMLMWEMIGPMSLLTDSPYGKTHLERVETTVRVREQMRQAELTDLTVRQPRVAPGERLRVDVELLPFRGEPIRVSCALDIPDDAPEGGYALTIGGASSYWHRYMEAHPHLQRITDYDALFEMVQRMAGLRSDAIYLLLTMNQPQVAIGRREMPDLPSSRRAMLLQATSSVATPYLKTIEKTEPLDYVVQGEVRLPIKIKRQPDGDD